MSSAMLQRAHSKLRNCCNIAEDGQKDQQDWMIIYVHLPKYEEIMNRANTLFMLANWGIKTNKDGNKLESHMWLLTDQEEAMEFVSCHKSKSGSAYKGERIILKTSVER